ncbi:phage tail protein [Pseudomonas sp. HK3]
MNLWKIVASDLVNTQLFKENKFDAYVLNSSILKTMGEDEMGIFLGAVNYDVVYEIENYCGDAGEILAAFILSLDEHDAWRDNEELDDPEFDIDDAGKGRVDVTIKVEFYEPLYMHENNEGNITYNSKRYSMGMGEAVIADSMALNVDVV